MNATMRTTTRRTTAAAATTRKAGIGTAVATTTNGRARQQWQRKNAARAAAALVTDEVTTTIYSEEEVLSMGFDKVGKPVPRGIPMSEVLGAIPKELFEKNNKHAYESIALTLVACAASQVLIAIVPNWLLPVAWAIAGTAFTGFFVLGHDCGHRSLHKSKTFEDFVGNALMSPLIYPYEAWRIKHNQHHNKTNMLVEDTAWHPVVEEELEEMHPFIRAATKTILSTPIKFFASILHWTKWHFDLSLYKKSEKPRVATSIACCAIFAAVAWPALVHFTGWFGFVKHWLMPWLGFHFWLSMFTLVHHTSPHIPFKPKEEWDPVQAQLGGTVHCRYPKWVEVLCFDINVHVPHHLSPRIPHYNLRKAYDAIKAKYGEYVNEATFGLPLVNMLVHDPHIYNEETNYISFKEHQKGRAL